MENIISTSGFNTGFLFGAQVQANEELFYQHLSIFISPAEIQAAIINDKEGKVTDFKSWSYGGDNWENAERKLTELYEQVALFKKKFRTTSVVYYSSITSVLPESLLDTSRSMEILSLSHKIGNDHKVFSEPLFNNEAVLLAALPLRFYELLVKLFPQARIFSFQKVLAQYAQEQFKLGKTNNVSVFSGTDQFTIIVLKGKDLIYLNNYHYKTTEDFCYYLFNTLDKLGLDEKETCIHLTGSVYSSGDKWEIITRYFSDVVVGNTFKGINTEGLPNAQVFMPVLTQHLCA